jgi:hypothetical protein
MPYDKYRNWSLNSIQPFFHDLKQQVLIDLAGTTDETDKLEILDSFEVYVQRYYRAELAKEVGDKLLNNLSGLVASAIEGQISYPTPMSRGRVVTKPE